ncbi:uncharacterized protein [Primulina huaijiensis]|uniref:uncharacterized protein n=1 Tax=Primulina huaijiensis TaxID=1492673 RepID=UPI003CC771A2
MPLVRVEVKNCYGLGVQELYREANKEDPKEILDGVMVAGLSGVLRQLGDLAESSWFNQYQDIESAKMQESKQLELPTSNRRREANQLKGIYEKEDFLHLIRSKSLNLRPIVIGKSKYGEPTSKLSICRPFFGRLMQFARLLEVMMGKVIVTGVTLEFSSGTTC